MGPGMKPFIFALIASLALAACSSGPSSPNTYTIGGTVINLAGAGGGLQLQDNGGDTLLVNSNGNFMFPTALAGGPMYDVTVYEQPSTPAQTCEVTHGMGTATADVASVAVDCGHNEWAWEGGSNLAYAHATYGTQGAPAAGNIPGGRENAVSWTDAAGNFWLFGGQGDDSMGNGGYLNDLWRFSAGEWTWMGGSDAINQQGTYGTQGVAAPGNVPGARYLASSWSDAAGNFWLFGGDGYDSSGTFGILNDLWKYSAGLWTWMGGSNVAKQKGTYGSQGVAAAGNIPGARDNAAGWTDASGNFWLFGGAGYDSSGTQGNLNDLWKYSASQWTWVSGSDVVNQKGIYGTQGMAAAGNVPGARDNPVAWIDAGGNFWLFGGFAYDSVGIFAPLNDLWKFSGGEWTWIGGPNEFSLIGPTYGTEGTAAPGNIPGPRFDAIGWTDAAGNLWLFGGYGFGLTGPEGRLSDLWKYSAGQWTWMNGPSKSEQNGIYGTQGTLFPGNLPGGRDSSVSWTDTAGNFWLFGGFAYDSAGTAAPLNDLWKYEP
jgi:galactose oxidase-like protein